MSNDLATLDTSQWEVMKQQAGMLVKTGFLPSEIKTAEQAVAIMLKGRELGIPPMYALSNIVVIKGKPSCDAALMLALIYRDHGDDAAKWDDEATNDKVATLLYKRRGWPEYKRHTFTIADAQTAGLAGQDTWKKYPGAMLRARCISAVARMAFPDSIGGMYTPEELGQQPEVVDEGHERAMRKLHAVAREHGIGHAELHAIAVQEYDVGSMSQLTAGELTEMTQQFVAGEIIDADTGEITDAESDLGKQILDEQLASIYTSKSVEALVTIGNELKDAGISDQTLRDAYQSRMRELTGRSEQRELVGAAAGSAGDDRHTQ